MANYRISENAKEDLQRIFYRVVGDTVEIMRILGQQDINEWL